MIIALPPSLHDSQKLLSYAERDRESTERPAGFELLCVCV